MSLEQYWRKRDFKQTPEPAGTVGASGDSLGYVIQKHAARNLHYDFRLELGGALKSWAVPKGPSLDPAQKRLAVQVEDHPLDYGGFEGIIPARQYGAGTVMLWDRGIWVPDGDPMAGYRKGHLSFQLLGEKLAGAWSLVRMARRGTDKQENWLLIKAEDAYARHGQDGEITRHRLHSVLSHRNMQEIAEGRRPPHPAATSTGKVSLPAFVAPQLATLATQLPGSGDWLAELKYDGYRMLARIAHGKVTLWTRNRQDWTRRIPDLVSALSALPVQDAWLDGEVVALDDHGDISFQALQEAFGRENDAKPATGLQYLVFDLPWCEGADLRALPQRLRKQRLGQLLAGLPGTAPIKYSKHIEGPCSRLPEAFGQSCRQGMEGLILKRADAAYAGKRSRHWLKLKCGNRQEFVVGGYTLPKGRRLGLGALLVGEFRDGGLHYAGRVGTGFSHATLGKLSRQLAQLAQSRCPFDAVPAEPADTVIRWVKPILVAETRFAGWTGARRLRQAVYLGLREDKPASEVTMERASRRPAQANSESATVAGVVISHPERVLFADTGLTKLDLARYYEAVAAHLLPQLRDRPLSLVRCPRGPAHPCFFQKHLDEGMPASLTAVTVQQQDGPARYMAANRLEALIGLVQLGVVELHTWNARRDRLDRPDKLILDLDPAPDVAWRQVQEGAMLIRSLLQELGLACFLKVTGGKGLHVEVPLYRYHDWATVKQFSERVARHLAALIPRRFTANMAKAQRKGRIFIDYLRNAEGATAVSAFSVRARPGAPVAVPISWEELAEGVRSDQFGIEATLQRLRDQSADPWADYDSQRARLTKAMLARLGPG
ncbi:DNA ligase D [Chitinimonas arctica]|uniref:DNA ligase (ATP) n=1 Tax=Chitinimonas arctica TaxID=2594795 RepID=A0A516S9R4_9NEIS|nr:DNA ligase D [Chitinimonas arctica]QDQ24901.1 DNA ligase D [Chitinimonas arctica]